MAIAGRDQEMRKVALRKTKIGPGKRREPRHSGDIHLTHFFGELNGAWLEVFDEAPGVSVNAGVVGGAYVNFAKAVLHRYATAIPDELEAVAPGLRHRLRLSEPAIHGNFRRTKFSRLRAIAKSDSA